MISLLIIISVFQVLMLANAWASALVARLVGSPRGRLKFGLVAVLLIAIANIVVFALWEWLSANLHDFYIMVPALCVYASAQLVVAYIILRRVFALGAKQAFAPFALQFAIGILVYAMSVGLFRPFVGEAFVIRARSMSPTLDPGDRFMVNKLIRPRRWDIVAYRTKDQREIYCQRLVGMPTDHLRFSDGKLFVNDKRLDTPAVLGELRASPADTPANWGLYREGQTIALKSDEYFFVGDNSDRSMDSRYFGPTPESSLVGVVDWIFWPLTKFRIVR